MYVREVDQRIERCLSDDILIAQNILILVGKTNGLLENEKIDLTSHISLFSYFLKTKKFITNKFCLKCFA